MENFTYHIPTKILFGKAVNFKVADEIAAAGLSRVLLLYGGSSVHKTGVYDDVTKALREKEIRYVECPGVKANPLLAKAEEAVSLMREHRLQAVLGVGGGSVIDSAKAIAAGVPYEGELWDYFCGRARPGAALPVYAVVTVSATASEMNATAVLTNEILGHKAAVTSSRLFPRCALIDPSVQASVPERQTVDGGIDAISHVMETYFDGTCGVEIQMEYGEGLIRSLMRLIPILQKEPGDYDARAQYAWGTLNALNGSTWAGHAGRGDFASHAMGHALSARYDHVHGETLAVMMPAWMRYVYRDNLGAFARFAERVCGVAQGSEEERALAGIDRIRSYFASLGAPTRLRDLDVPRGDLPGLADVAARNGAIGVVKKLDREDILKIYEMAY